MQPNPATVGRASGLVVAANIVLFIFRVTGKCNLARSRAEIKSGNNWDSLPKQHAHGASGKTRSIPGKYGDLSVKTKYCIPKCFSVSVKALLLS